MFRLSLLLSVPLYGIAAAWLWRAAEAHRGLPTIPDLLLPQPDATTHPTITVIVPARNEQGDILATLRSLLAQDYPALQILAVDDRSTDRTGELMDTLAGPGLSVLHIEALPPGWLGKSHAMWLAAQQATGDYLLFTDADILFHPTAIRLAIASALTQHADHFVLIPTTIIRRWDEGALLSFFQIFGLWAARPWRVADPAAQDAIGIGAFNLISRAAYERIGTFGAFPLEIVEDLGLARRVKQAGLRQRVAFGRGLASVHWAAGLGGLINTMTKNIFSVFNFHVVLLLFACVWLFSFNVAPFLLLAWYPIPCALTIGAIAYAYILMGRSSGLSAWNALLTPFAACAFLYAILKSMFVTLRQGGVLWRGTFYSLVELRRNTAPLIPSRKKI